MIMKSKTYLIKNIPPDLWEAVQAHKVKTGIPLKRLILDGLREKLKRDAALPAQD